MNKDKNRIKIAFLTSADPKDKRSWSGVYYYMAKALQDYCGDVFLLGPVDIREKVMEKPYRIISSISPEKKYDSQHSIHLSLEYAKIFEEKLREQPYDVIFAPAASTEIAFIDTNIPIVYSSDTTFALISDYYPVYSNLLDISMQEGNIIEGLAIKKAKALLYPLEWAAKSAINDYNANPSKIHIASFGPNLDYIPPKSLILNKKKSDKCKLLFISVDWQRKGGEIAFETLLALEKLGLSTELIVCGCTPPSKFSHDNMIVIPFLSKNNSEEAKKLYGLYYQSDFLLVPSRSECGGCIFKEVGAFGLPCITTDTGAISENVKEDISGYLLSPESNGDDYANLICRLYKDDQTYYRLIKSSREHFDSKLTWKAWSDKVNNIINIII